MKKMNMGNLKNRVICKTRTSKHNLKQKALRSLIGIVQDLGAANPPPPREDRGRGPLPPRSKCSAGGRTPTPSPYKNVPIGGGGGRAPTKNVPGRAGGPPLTGILASQ